MQEINFDVLEDPFKFELIMLPCSCYQKKNGEVAVMKGSFLEQLLEKAPSLKTEIAKAVENMGNCPSILSSIPGSPIPTKFCTFPVTPTSLRAEDPDKHVFNRLKGNFKKYKLLPGWMLLPRSDMVEFSAFKLSEIIRYYKLTKVIFQYEAFTFDAEDKEEYTRVRNIMAKYLKEGVFIARKPVGNIQGEQHVMTTSSVTMEKD